MSWSQKVAVRVVNVVGTMACAGIFAVLALISAPAAFTTGDPLVIVAWVAQTFLQLVLSPVIMVGQGVQAAKTEQVIWDTHQIMVGEHADTRELLRDVHAIATAVHATIMEVPQ